MLLQEGPDMVGVRVSKPSPTIKDRHISEQHTNC
jgi:hypothetical protein